MSLETVSDSVVALCIGMEDLTLRGLDTSLSGSMARVLVREALISKGVSPWPDMEVDLFSNADGLLLFARPVKAELHCFCFTDFEALLAAISRCDFSPESRLTYFSGKYYLNITSSSTALCGALFEFGEYLSLPRGMCSHIFEHGEVIIAHNAVSALRNNFLLIY